MSTAKSHADPLAHLTPAQREAIRTVDRSLLVSAAAGSGKTTVLAERCVALVCDVPEGRRCGIEELLVVTFTDAAAEEMRTRIRDTLRRRLECQPASEYLQRQIYMLESASISTIHAFCKTLIERWFPQAEVDPQASVLSEEEADLLREEVLHELFVSLYGEDSEPARAFQAMVDDYGAGDDRGIALMVQQLHDFAASLPDPDEWLEKSVRRIDLSGPESLLAQLEAFQSQRLREELSLQAEHCQHLAATIRTAWPVANMHAEALEEHYWLLRRWQEALGTLPVADFSTRSGRPPCRPFSNAPNAGTASPGRSPASPVRSTEAGRYGTGEREEVSGGQGVAGWEQVAQEIREFQFGRAKSRPRDLSDEDKVAFDAAKALRDSIKKLFTTRLQQQVCRFTAAEYQDGLRCVGPYVRTLTWLVREFERRYTAAKSRDAAVDFNDLQRRALRLLCSEDDTSKPSQIARQLQKRYRYVLVDEFQDVDPLQEGILRLVSRESADPAEGNLFTVGDIKQSIYRFRLAEPKLFTQRADRFAAGTALGRVIHLQENFRSRAPVLDAVNLVFEPLMSRHFGGSAYDDSARLKPGAKYPEKAVAALFGRPAVELHLLEPVTERNRQASVGESNDEGDEADERESEASTIEDELEGIEREAFLIGRRIQQWMGDNPKKTRWHVAGRPETPGGEPVPRPMAYRDIVILLRSLPHKAEPIAEVLRRMGMPVRIEKYGSSMEATELRDCVSVLQLLDNGQQDLPLAAVLRSPLLGDSFDESELLELRLIDREGPFHAAVQRYADQGPKQCLRERVQGVLRTLERYRTRIQRAPVAEVLWELYEEFDYLGYVCGLPDGARRRENLIRLHELARQFGRFSRQGLRRFLTFIEELAARDRQPRQAVAGGDENCIRIMTVHASKGLEFPVVILADLHKRFNLEDLGRTMLVDRECGVALRAVDPERRVFYPTLAHQIAAETARRENLSEELRVLYVALTRAREHLLLTGRIAPERVQVFRSMRRAVSPPLKGEAGEGISPRIARLQLECATCPLEWLMAAICSAPAGCVRWHGEAAVADDGLFKVFVHPRTTTDGWRIPPAVRPERAAVLAALADFGPLPDVEQVNGADRAGRIVADLCRPYEAMVLTSLPGRLAVGELKRRWDVSVDPAERVTASRLHVKEPPSPAFLLEKAAADGAARGSATHRFLQLVDLQRPCDAVDLARQRDELVTAGRLTSDEAASLLLNSAVWFFEADLGRRLRARAADVRREVAFDARITPEQYDPDARSHDCRDVILIRGVVDAILCGPADLEILDYKTDTLAAAACGPRAESYQPQIQTYAAAMTAIYRRPVARAWIVFLHARQIIEVSSETPGR